MKESSDVVFANEIVEADGSTHAVQKGTGNTAYKQRSKPSKSQKGSVKDRQYRKGSKQETKHGRMLCIRGRFTKQAVMKPLRPKSHARGAPSGGETSREISGHLQKHLQSNSVIACTDAGTGLKKAMAGLNIPHATARHNLDEMTPLRKLAVKDLGYAQAKVLKKAAVAKRPAAQFSPQKRKVTVVSGDNGCESEFARNKQQLRRLNLLGRSSPQTSHVDVLATRRLLQNPGIQTCLHALKVYRQDRAGQLGHDPRHMFDLDQDQAWLWT